MCGAEVAKMRAGWGDMRQSHVLASECCREWVCVSLSVVCVCVSDASRDGLKDLESIL